jgi:hypothetical protein
MIFKGFTSEVHQELIRWNLSSATMRSLCTSLLPLVDNCLDAVTPNSDGLWFAASFDDPENVGHKYYLKIRVDGDDDGLWAYYIQASRYDDDDHLVWLEEAPKSDSASDPQVPI